MAFSIEEIKGVVNKNLGLYRPAFYALRLNFAGNGVSSSQDINLLAFSATLPGVQFDTADIRRQGHGPLERRARGAVFPAVNVNFFLDNKGTVIEFFNKWSKTIVSFAHQTGENSIDPDHGGYLGEVGFYDDYVCSIDIILYSPNEDKVVTYTLYDAYPVVVGDVELGWQQTDEFARLNVTFAYRYWTSTVFKPSERSNDPGSMNLFQFINKVKGAVDIAKTLKKPKSVGDAINVLNNGKLLTKSIFGN